MNVYIPYTRLPSAYQEVEYIESSGTQWINTGYIPTVNTEIETDISWSATQPGTWACFFGVTGNDTSGNGILARIYNSSSTTFNPRFCNSTYGEAQITVTTDTFHNITLKKNGGSIDGTAYTLTTSGTPYQSAIYLFDANNSGTHWNRYTICKIKTFKISESGVLQRDLVPCYRKSDSVIGLYDLVNDSFYTNSGSGTFSKGNDVTKSEIKNIYIGNPTVQEEYTLSIGSSIQRVSFAKSGMKIINILIEGNVNFTGTGQAYIAISQVWNTGSLSEQLSMNRLVQTYGYAIQSGQGGQYWHDHQYHTGLSSTGNYPFKVEYGLTGGSLTLDGVTDTFTYGTEQQTTIDTIFNSSTAGGYTDSYSLSGSGNVKYTVTYEAI